jgi:hypothetical protein
MNSAITVIVNDWESVIESDKTVLLIKDGVIGREQVMNSATHPRQGPRPPATSSETRQGIIYYKNNSGRDRFAAAGSIVYRKALAEGSNKTIPTGWLGSDLSFIIRPDSGHRPTEVVHETPSCPDDACWRNAV